MKKTVFLTLMMAFAFIAYAKEVPKKKATQVALNKYYEVSDVSKSGITAADVFTVYNNSTPLYYVVNISGNNGFVIVSAEDKTRPVLGYTLRGTYSPDIQPAAFSDYMSGIKEEIVYVKQLKSSGSGDFPDEWDYYSVSASAFEPVESKAPVVSPLLDTITWNQSAGWNDDCPEDASGPGGHVYAGCVAVSAAQIMKYWEYPSTGTGSHSYTHATYGYLSANFGSTTYD